MLHHAPLVSRFILVHTSVTRELKWADFYLLHREKEEQDICNEGVVDGGGRAGSKYEERPWETIREYWMIYRWSGRLAVLWFVSSSTYFPHSPVSNFSLFLSLALCRRSSLPTGEGLGEEPTHTIAIKPGPLWFIQYSLGSIFLLRTELSMNDNVYCSGWVWGGGWLVVHGGGGGVLNLWCHEAGSCNPGGWDP